MAASPGGAFETDESDLDRWVVVAGLVAGGVMGCWR